MASSFVPIIHTDTTTSDIFKHVKNMVVRAVLFNENKDGAVNLDTDTDALPNVSNDGILTPTDDTTSESKRVFYTMSSYGTNARENGEDFETYRKYLSQVPAPNHVIVITGKSVRITSIETPMQFDWVHLGLVK